MEPKKCQQLLHFSQVLEATAEKHKQFAEQLETRDMEIFFIIPFLLILKSLENDDKEICSFFYPDMFDIETKQGQQFAGLKKSYEEGRISMGNDYDYYNLIEKCLIEVPLTEDDKLKFESLEIESKLVKEIKGLAMCLSRFKPADWNKFLDVVIRWIVQIIA